MASAADFDEDGVPDAEDNHPCVYNPEQSPVINDTVGMGCIDGSGGATGGTAGTDTNPGGSAGDGNGNDNQPIADFDEDGIPDSEDNHPCVFNEDQAPVAYDTQGTSCIDGSTSTGGAGGDGGQGAGGGDEGGTSGAIEAPVDSDEDGIPDSEDNHPCIFNEDQAPVQNDTLGTSCIDGSAPTGGSNGDGGRLGAVVSTLAWLKSRPITTKMVCQMLQIRTHVSSIATPLR